MVDRDVHLETRRSARSRGGRRTSATTASSNGVAELHDHLEPLRPPRLPGAAERADRPTTKKIDGREDRRRDADRRARAGGLRLPVPRRPVRHRGQPHRRPARARARPLRVLDRRTATSSSARSTASRKVDGHGRERADLQVRLAQPRACTSTGSRSPLPAPAAALADGDAARQQPAGSRLKTVVTVPARLARGALGPRRRRQVLPLPQGAARHELVPHARLGDADRVPRPGDDRRDPRDVLQAGSRTRAYESIQHITNDLTLGWLVRGMHRWGASVFIILMFFHMARVFLFGAYKYPRELNWIVGVLLLALGHVRGLHRLPAAVGPDGVLGDGRRHQHQRHGAVRRPVPRAVPAGRAPRSARHAQRASTRCTCS